MLTQHLMTFDIGNGEYYTLHFNTSYEAYTKADDFNKYLNSSIDAEKICENHYVMFQQDVLLCCVLCHRELKDVRPRTIIRGSRLPIPEISEYQVFLQPSRETELYHQCQQEHENPSHQTPFVTNLRVSSAPADTRVKVSGERQVCNTLSV